ncbi:MAG: UDP-N-acetylglucosamine 2-epimerase (non-hydrolyzing) [Verrucomicrobia bacterium]|nr:UDP-N-acetylglucosamine 2-epimerase (non-hydrolyzing) [Verrucomicrobiota bacterium]
MKLCFIYGTRPEFIKLAPLIMECKRRPGVISCVVNTGQHKELLESIHDAFAMRPDHDLEVMRKGQSLAELTARAVDALGRLFRNHRFDMTIVQGDTTSAMTGALVSFYHKTPVLHVEAGLRTNDKYSPFPEEINRCLISRIADLHCAPTTAAQRNLLSDGVPAERVRVTGNTVIDALEIMISRMRLERVAKQAGRNILVTLHRRENFGQGVENVCSAILMIVEKYPDVTVTWPVHENPNVKDKVYSRCGGHDRIELLEPAGYVEFIRLLNRCHFVMSDSGGVQEEAPSLNKPVLVLRDTTERPEGVEMGVAKLVGCELGKILSEADLLLLDDNAYAQIANRDNPYGDGKAASRIFDWIEDYLRTETKVVV